MAVPAKILELVERFDRNRDAYKQGKYNEAQIRREFGLAEVWTNTSKMACTPFFFEESIRYGQDYLYPA